MLAEVPSKLRSLHIPYFLIHQHMTFLKVNECRLCSTRIEVGRRRLGLVIIESVTEQVEFEINVLHAPIGDT